MTRGLSAALRALLASTALIAAPALAEAPPPPPAPASTAPLMTGLLPVRADIATGRILVTLPAPGADGVSGRFIYSTSLRTGIGSPNMRLDRGMLGPSRLLVFRRYGKKIAIQFENPRFRATGGTPAEQASARDSFPITTVWMGDIVQAEADGRVTIDIAPFLTRDVIGIGQELAQGGAKGFKVADNLSAADLGAVKVFPDNIEMEALQTYQSDTPAGEVNSLAPDPRQISFVVHHSLVRLPEPGYVARRFDPRAGGFANQIVDFGTPLTQNVVYQLANRFRLEKVDPSAPRSKVKKPIIFYIDPAAPEPIRSALVEGVGWWAQAFDAAGFIDGFQAKVLPPGVDPLDVRYNFVNWSNRATRGWSYGQVITDPRTGEIIKGNVVLGSLRSRQDMIIFEGLVGTDKLGKGGPNDPVEVTLARLRQLGAHEVGHSLGFVHNFAASTQGRASVMDYPGPKIGLVNGAPDLTDAYARDIGSWDKFTVDWLYGQAAPGVDPDAAAREKAEASVAAGVRFITDIDGRAPDTPNPWGSMWDNGPDPAAELTRLMAVRKAAIARFGQNVLLPHEPVADLRRRFVPIWLLHRYQVDATAKMVGGVDYVYAVQGDGTPPAKPVAPATQRAALDALLGTLSADQLEVPDGLVGLLSAGINGASDRQSDIEVFANAGAAAFDPLAAADVGAQVTLDTLLAPPRLIRVFEQHRRDPGALGLDELVDKVLTATVETRKTDLSRRIAYRAVMALAEAARDPDASPDVAAAINARLTTLADQFAKGGAGPDGAWSRSLAHILTDDALLEKELAKTPRAPAVPPGMPIGAETDWMDDL
ncbi:zinc-dependent metalloprotease [Phenylobacterium aquaticum]|uniref:zinc-dependent metalloprotease n=2 Tax=Phenylobacterium aquaticum TaxID=1763816 RepID=UPI0026EA0434|nr:zinc-dependent metalloprotease [Phenylobacterium aquaticum]